ncbi:MAG: undecaprenyldiphospho-muramoylpentapeptide beta-N-acetylglucosaminyltransferase [Clostridia bacterium]|nr:undecaprenyldiphospho-muramoylpentapeptide beta-N-acetylglucosaminyltransferase [Clostridia bacterium]
MRIILCGGGTAGHVSPAVAIAEYCREKDEDAEFLFIGREGGRENDVIEKSGFRLQTLKITGLERKISLTAMKAMLVALRAKRKARSIISGFKPDAVIGTGGYVSWPVIRAAQELNIPTLIHESNASAGLVTRLLAPRCDRVLLNFKGSDKEFKSSDNVRFVGNPVREQFFTTSKADARRKLGIPQRDFLITSIGGSGGSLKINSASVALMKAYSTKNRHVRHIHSCGIKYYDSLKERYPELTNGSDGCIIKPYIEDMPTVMTASDVVVSRCGAMTISELSAAGVAAILVPSPNVTGNHQYKNAKLLCDRGAAIMIEDSEVNERTLLDAVRKLGTDEKLRRSLSTAIKGFHDPSSAELIYRELLGVISR